jgi:hypothetical protein
MVFLYQTQMRKHHEQNFQINLDADICARLIRRAGFDQLYSLAGKCGVSKKDRDAARGQDCKLEIPFVCNSDPDTTVLAHVGRHGTAKRNHDDEAIYACSACHDAIDYRTNIFLSNNESEQKLLRKDRAWYIARALDRMPSYFKP